MKQEILFRAVGEIGDDLIARADRPVQKIRRCGSDGLPWRRAAYW